MLHHSWAPAEQEFTARPDGSLCLPAAPTLDSPSWEVGGQASPISVSLGLGCATPRVRSMWEARGEPEPFSLRWERETCSWGQHRA